ncbi:MAG TPA: thioredoxin family protein [Acidobacteriaceae bacterium]|nr:thioredoxin family protein [Acidobacteriaceae bacterium]
MLFRAARNTIAALIVLTTGVFASAQYRILFSPTANAHAEIARAIRTATREHKRIILDFGGNWCADCQVLYIYMHQPPNDEIAAKHFIVVHVDVGRYDKNLDLARKYNIPLKLGVPALAVLNSRGRLLYSQKHGEFERMSIVDPGSITEFLEKWK